MNNLLAPARLRDRMRDGLNCKHSVRPTCKSSDAFLPVGVPQQEERHESGILCSGAGRGPSGAVLERAMNSSVAECGHAWDLGNRPCYDRVKQGPRTWSLQ